MSFVIPIRIDPPSLTPIQQTERALDGVERKGSAAGKAVAKSMREGSIAAEKARTAVVNLGDAFAAIGRNALGANLAKVGEGFRGLNDALRLEADLLERIHGPLKSYERELMALDSMLGRNKVSTHEYAEQVRRLNRELGESSIKETALNRKAPASGGSKTKSGIGGIGIGGALGAGAAAYGLVSTAMDIGDGATNQTNSLMRLTDQYRDLGRVRGDMLAMSSALHADLGGTADLFDAVRDGAEDMNLTYREQIELTRALGAVVRLDNKSLGDAAGAMEKLSYAMASGKIESRELKGLMREFPQLAQVWTDKFDVSRVKLIELVSTGKVGIDELVKAAMAAGPELEKQLSDRPKTWSGQWARFTDELSASVAYMQGVNEQSSTVDQNLKAMAFGGPLERIETMIDSFGDSSAGWANIMTGINTRVLPSTHDLLRGIVGEHLKIAESAADVAKVWDRIDAEFAKGRTKQALMEVELGIKNVIGSVEETTKAYEKAEKAAAAWRASTEYALLQVSRGPMEKHEEQLRALDNLWRRKIITAPAEYSRLMTEIMAKAPAALADPKSYESFNRKLGVNVTSGEMSGHNFGDSEYTPKLGEAADFYAQVPKLAEASEKKRVDAAIDAEADIRAARKQTIDSYASAIAGYIDPFADGLIDAAHGADVAWQDMIQNLISGIEKAILKMIILKAVEAGLNALLPGAGTAASVTGLTSVAVDAATSRTVQSAPSGPSGGGGSGMRTVSGSPVVNVQIIDNPRQLLSGIDSREGLRSVSQLIRRNPALGRSLMRRQ